jgi:hypothetical protein
MTGPFQLSAAVMLESELSYAVSTRFDAQPLHGNAIEGCP